MVTRGSHRTSRPRFLCLLREKDAPCPQGSQACWGAGQGGAGQAHAQALGADPLPSPSSPTGCSNPTARFPRLPASLPRLGTRPTETATRPTPYQQWMSCGEVKDRGGKWPRNHERLLTPLSFPHPLSSRSLVKLLPPGVAAPELGCTLLGGRVLFYLPKCLAFLPGADDRGSHHLPQSPASITCTVLPEQTF